MHNIFDSHAHYDDRKFDEDREILLSSFPDAGVSGVINCGSDLASSEFTVKLCEQYPFMWGAAGVHPHEAEDADASTLEAVAKLLQHEKIVAVGEIGLDYHYDFSPREKQKEIFEAQIRIAKELDLPIIVHDREAHEDTMRLLKQYQPKGVVHCFSGSVELAKETVKLGMYIGLGGATTFKNARKPVEVAKWVPLESLLLETDAPYMTPVPLRGKRCTSLHIPYTAEKIALERDMDPQELLNAAVENAKRLFQIP